MAIDFSRQESNKGNYLEALQAFDYGRQSRIKEVEQQRQQADFARKDQARALIGQGAPLQSVRAVDPQSAYDYAEHLRGVDKETVAKQFAEAKALVGVGKAIRAIPAGDPRRMQLLQQAAPLLQASGVTPEEMSRIDINDDGVLDSIIGANDAFIGQAEQYTLAPGSIRFDAKGRRIAEAPFAPQLRTVGEGQSLVEVQPGGGGQSSSDAIPFDNLIRQESGGNQFTSNGRVTTSPKGALGIAQIMPGTASEAAKLAGLPYDPARLRNDPQYNRALGEAYYNEQRRAFGRDDLAAAAYNAGPGAVQRALRRGGPHGYLRFLPVETQDYVRKVSGGSGLTGGSRVVAQGAPKSPSASETRAAERENRADRKDIVTLRKEFDGLPEVKSFKIQRTAINQIRGIVSNKNPTAQDDIALIFSFMRMLDPNSVVREGEFALAQNAASVPESVRNMYNKALSGERLNQSQRLEMLRTASRAYGPARDTYNAAAESYRGYAKDIEASPDQVARRYVPDGKPSTRVRAVPPAVAAALAKYGAR